MRLGAVDQHVLVMTIPHHEAGIALANLAFSRARRLTIRALARSIKISQSRENEQLVR